MASVHLYGTKGSPLPSALAGRAREEPEEHGLTVTPEDVGLGLGVAAARLLVVVADDADRLLDRGVLAAHHDRAAPG